VSERERERERERECKKRGEYVFLHGIKQNLRCVHGCLVKSFVCILAEIRVTVRERLQSNSCSVQQSLVCHIQFMLR